MTAQWNSSLLRSYFSWQITKYLARDILASFVSGVVIFLLIMLMFQGIRLADFVIVHQVALKDIGLIAMYLALSFVPIAIPIAFLFAILMGISRANSEGEILALQSTGTSLPQLLVPLTGFSVVVTVVALYMALFTVPQGNRSFELLITRLHNEKAMAALKPGVFQENFHGLVLLAETVIPVRNEMKNIFLYDDRDDKAPLSITAEAGSLQSDPKQGILRLRLSKGSIHVDHTTPDVLQRIDFDIYDINLELGGRGSTWRSYSPPSYNYNQLKERLADTRQDATENRKLLVEWHRRFSLSFACLVFGVLGFSIGIQSRRGIRSAAIVLCLVVALLYWIGYVAANAMAISGWVAPWVAIWLPNFLFLGVAWYCYHRYSGA